MEESRDGRRYELVCVRLLKKMAEAHCLVPEFEVLFPRLFVFYLWRLKCKGECFLLCVYITLEGTRHGPITTKPMFLEIGEFLSFVHLFA